MGSNNHHHHHHHHQHLLLLPLVFLILCFFSPCESSSWGWFSSSSLKDTTFGDSSNYRNSVAEFSTEGLGDRKGMKLVDNAKSKMVGSNSCWQKAYQNVFAGCSEILAVDEKRSRLAWYLSDCFQRDSGRSPFPHCDSKSSMPKCLKNLDDLAHKVYLEFYLETNSICYHLQLSPIFSTHYTSICFLFFFFFVFGSYNLVSENIASNNLFTPYIYFV